MKKTAHLKAMLTFVNSVCITNDNKHIATASNDKSVCIWSLKNGEIIRVLADHSNWVNSVCVTSDNQYIVSGICPEHSLICKNYKTIHIWRIGDGKKVRVIEASFLFKALIQFL